MIKVISIIILSLILTISFCAQKRDSVKTSDLKYEIPNPQIKFDKSKPSVYLEFERVGMGKPLYYGDSKERVWLKFVNNTQWSIFAVVFVFGENEEHLGFFYEIEREGKNISKTEIPKGYRSGDSRLPESEVEAGKSVSFSVPKNHLSTGLKIRIDFIFDWEYGKEINQSFYSEPRHSVYFSSSQLKAYLK